MSKSKYLEINGAFGEGGGAILRLSTGFSVLFNQPVKIINIRANRPKPGLRLQHLIGLQTLANLTGSELKALDGECNIGTQELIFKPGFNIQEKIKINVRTAANVGLLLQPIQIASLNFMKTAQIEIFINGGGTFGKWAPSLNYLKNVTYEIFKKSGLNILIDINKYGFYPKGGALTKCTIFPPKTSIKPLNLMELGTIDLIEGEIILSNQLKQGDRNIGERIKKSINLELRNHLKIETEINFEYVDATSPGVGLCLWACSDTGAIISSGTILGERNITSERLGKIASKEILRYIKNDIPVDNHLSDQLIPLIAYNKEPSSLRVLEITNHTKTNLDLVKLFTHRSYEIIKERNSYLIKLN
ncbi:MAG: RNA 3'-terminal phosphate cyclase [Candidatus Odinarchaeota archaeon]